ncbi:MAG: OmpA family protein [Gammaproteobacteria bacterium]|nr:OmpA family protein [Gammaproteobacteria bacterium]
MNKLFIKAVSIGLATLAVSVSAPVFADDVGYWTSSAGKVWKNRFGECWRSGGWSSDMAVEECDPVSRDEPEPEPEGLLDSDGDGVPDFRDWCAGTPAGVEVDNRGCPLDSDGDGVPDYLDRCPNTAANTRVDEHGCPYPGTALFTLEGVHFEFDSARLKSSAEAILQQAVRKLRDNSGVAVDVVGHTDSTGPDAYNRDLSKRRAQSVADYLTANGISSSRLTVRGEGESNPVTSNDTREGRAMNRRVELTVGE